MCGGTDYLRQTPAPVKGLSPRVRGNPLSARNHTVPSRSIPACAGEPCHAATPSGGRTVYPRVCGGTAEILCRPSQERGLSPRVRGNPPPWAPATPSPGSIPACAGEPEDWWVTVIKGEVYPRVCGGTVGAAHAFVQVDGLSPRVRGNRGNRRRMGAGEGSIPACAGEPSCKLRCSTAIRVYPRVCGGTRGRQLLQNGPQGLSPRVRGNLTLLSAVVAQGGSIPACAGEPGLELGFRANGQVYPRVCGGTTRTGKSSHRGRGLSPRVRGNPFPPAS